MSENIQAPPETITIEVEPPQVFIKIADAIKKYSISRSKLLQLVDSGEIQAFRPRLKGTRKGMLLIEDESVLNWVKRFPATATVQNNLPHLTEQNSN